MLNYFNQNLIYLREQKGYTQEQMSAKLCEVCSEEIKLKRYQSWEEARAFPPAKVLVRICDVLQYKDIYSLLTERLNK